ncbi:hypothetical protein B0H19DRAFT_906517, partial [Mycena capillaripes]
SNFSTHPEISKKAHAESDRVVGRDRLPSSDYEQNLLSYCHAIIKEILHIQGQFIPRDTIAVVNTWTMYHEPSRHPEP